MLTGHFRKSMSSAQGSPEELQYLSELGVAQVLEQLIRDVLQQKPKDRAELYLGMARHIRACAGQDCSRRGSAASADANMSLRVRGGSGRSGATAAQIERARDGLTDLHSDRLDILRGWAPPAGLGLLDAMRALDLGDLSEYCLCPICGRSTSDLEAHLRDAHQRRISEAPAAARATLPGLLDLAVAFADRREREGCTLRLDHVLAQHLYTMETPIYRVVNRLLRDKQTAALQPWLPFLHFLKESLVCLEPYVGIAYRGIDVAVVPDMYKIGRIVTWQVVPSDPRIHLEQPPPPPATCMSAPPSPHPPPPPGPCQSIPGQ